MKEDFLKHTLKKKYMLFTMLGFPLEQERK